MKKYYLKCTECGAEYDDDRFRLKCDGNHSPALLRSVYWKNGFSIHHDKPGMFKFSDFLPVERTLDVSGAPVTYRSEALAEYLGLQNLYIIFNGYWPEKNAYMYTASFKELEAPSVLARIPEDHDGTIVVASAGNTGRAFAHICSQNDVSLFLVVPEENAGEIWSTAPYKPCIKLILAAGDSDYFDAITLANRIVEIDGFFPEGGAANIARRDGMGTTVLDAACTIGRIPDHYFQAVGSGTGGIAAWESSIRLKKTGLFGENRMRLHLSQNAPFTPMSDAYKNRQKNLPVINEKEAKDQIRQIRAKVLSNRKPPYSITGGVWDVLEESSGCMYSVTNLEIDEATRMFERLEGVDIHPAGAIALGSLIQAVRGGIIDKDDIIALNITGGGEKKVKNDCDVYQLEPFARFTDREIHSDEIMKKIENMLAAV